MKAVQKVSPKLYAYRITWSAEDEEFVGTCAEFPSLSWLEEDQAAALQGICELVADTIKELEQTGESVPKPLSERNFSGKFQVRIPPSLHRELATKAAEENVSLNRLVGRKLATA
ncbi:toxin-antitoxin system HicB family antitoxin [Romeria aff. gracilis LEGE 07310]|uniref:Toxin-antitoxin system HicB family antitoxin n=1 Tax=Vasconcelosia minhoensis LEGE 07310 TaxID=915328 RepID=A0A8J7AVJ6_9CYAN|nr:toxin-antitoxin system HicB family antitoxin [Romeria gracilis]MBE9079959.1 toxin-antitoxin system HicB family antitoxin [Romeria aff. gracilis LEGE 07310]